MESESNRESGHTDTDHDHGVSGTIMSAGHFSSTVLLSSAANCHKQYITEIMRLEKQDN